MNNVSEELIEKVDSANYKCPECGAPMKYNPSTQSLSCDYCNNNIVIKEQASNIEFDLDKVLEVDVSWQKENHVIRCKNCGSENVVSKKEISLICPFCSSTQVVEVDSLAGLKPNRVIPFKIDKKQAFECYQNIIKRKIFVPKAVKKMMLELLLNGVYVPIWTYDTNTFSTYVGRLGKHYTTTVGSGKNRRTVTRTRYFRISGTKVVDFDDLAVNAGNSIDQKDLNKIQPFNTNGASEFNEGFLAGFCAEHYSKTVNKGFDEAKQSMKGVIRYQILRNYSYDVVDYLNINTHYDNIKYKYVLVPVWFGLFKYKNKNYRFLVNGENGKITAMYPKSFVKILLFVLAIVAIFIGLLVIVANFG